MSQPVATVSYANGQVWAKAPDGSLRPLQQGSVVNADEVVVTAEGASVELDFGDGIPVAIAGNQSVSMGRDLWDELAATADEAAVDDESVQQALAILEQGGDLLEELEDTAAGMDGGSGGGNSFVQLTRLVIDTPELGGFSFNDPTTPGVAVLENNGSSVVDYPPVADDVSVIGDEDTSISGRVIAIDPNGDRLTYTISTQPQHGSVSLDSATGQFVYVPNADYNGTDSFVVTITDPRGNSTTSTVGITITPVNDEPVVTPIMLADINEDGSITITQADLLAGASDVDGDTLIAVNLTLTSGNGSLTDNGDGTWTFTPTADWNSSVTFDFGVSDGTVTVPNTAGLNVLPVNDAPVVSPITLADINEDGTITITQSDLLAGATDVDGDTLTAVNLTLTSGNGSLVDNGDGTWTFTPTADWNGAVTFDFEVSDGTVTVPNTAGLNVLPVNDAPVVIPIVLSDINEDGSITITQADLLVGATDVDGDTLTAVNLTLTSGNGSLIDNGDGTWTFTPTVDWNGAVSFDFEVSDGTVTVPNTAGLNVLPVNDAPVVSPIILADLNEDGSITITQSDLLAGATDVDGDVLTAVNLTLTSGNGLLIDNGDGTWTFTPTADWNGAVTFDFDVSDGTVTVPNTAGLNVLPVNDAPVVSPITLADINEDGSITITQADLLAGATDVDGDTLTAVNLTLINGNGSLIDNGDGTWTFTPTADWNGAVSFDFEVSDGTVTVPNTAGLNVLPVNDAPVVTPIVLADINEDGSITITQSDLLAGATDVDGDTLTAVNLTLINGNGPLIDNGDGTWTFTPTADWNGAVSFDFEVSDGTVTVPNTAGLNVLPVNDAPVVTPIVLADINEDGSITITQTDLLAGATDVDGDTLTAVNLTLTSGNGSLIDNGDGTWTFTPTADWNGAVSFDFEVSDGTVTVPNTAGLNVLPVNDAPVVSPITLADINEDGSITITQADLLAGATDVDGDVLTAVNLTLTSGNGSLIDNGDGTWTFTPTADWNGAVSFDFEVSDGTVTVPNTAGLNVLPVNDAPVVSPITLADINEDGTITITQSDLLVGATDIDGDVLTAVNLTLTSGNGSLIDNGDGTWTFTPTADWSGAVSFDFEVSDGTVTVPNTAGLNVLPVNDAPVVSPITLADINEDGTITITQSDLLVGATDIDGDVLTAVNLTLTSGNGSLIDNGDGTWTFTPTADWNGAVTFDFEVSDGTVTVPNTAGLTVLPVNDAPVVSPITLADINEDGTITITQADLLVGATDVDGDTLTAVNLTLISGNGSLIDNGDGTWTFTPTADWNGAVTFDFEVSDGTVTVPNTAGLNVLPVADVPSLTVSVTPITGSLGLAVPPSVGLGQAFFDDIEGVDTTVALDPEAVEAVVEATTPTSSTIVTEVFLPTIGVDDAYHYTAYIYLEAGHSYQLNGSRDDTLLVKIGGTIVYNAGYDQWGPISDDIREGNWSGAALEFPVSVSGYYSLEIIAYNGNEAGNLSLSLSVDGAAPLALNTSNFHLYPDATYFSANILPATYVPNNDGGYYPNQATEYTYFQLNINSALAALNEVLELSVTAIPEGVTLTDGTNVFVATSALTSVDITAWNLGNMQVIPPAGYVGNFTFNVTATSIDGTDSASVTNTVSFDVPNNNVNTILGTEDDNLLTGTAGADAIYALNGNDIIIGGAGNDLLLGGLGADTFVWNLGDQGVAGAPAVDVIGDFNLAEGDVLNLADLLQGEENNPLTNYLHFENDGSNTHVHISSAGGYGSSGYDASATDQIIILEGVNLTGSNAEIITQLQNLNSLQVD